MTTGELMSALLSCHIEGKVLIMKLKEKGFKEEILQKVLSEGKTYYDGEVKQEFNPEYHLRPSVKGKKLRLYGK